MNLREAVKTRARVEGDLVMVDDFLNHRVEPDLMRSVGRELASALDPFEAELLLTAEASGIPVALAVAMERSLPMVYAKKYVGTGRRYAFARDVSSPTKGFEYRVEVAHRVLEPGVRVAVVDDFLSRGRTAEALGEIAEEAGCTVVCCGFALEKAYEPGRSRLESHGWPVQAVVRLGRPANGVVDLL